MPTLFNKNLRIIMQQKGVSSIELSKLTGIPKGTIYEYRSRGERTCREPTSFNLSRMADALGVTMDELYRGDLGEEIEEY